MSKVQNYFNSLVDKYNNEKYHIAKKSIKNEMISFVIGLELSGNNIEANLCKDKFSNLENEEE